MSLFLIESSPLTRSYHFLSICLIDVQSNGESGVRHVMSHCNTFCPGNQYQRCGNTNADAYIVYSAGNESTANSSEILYAGKCYHVLITCIVGSLLLYLIHWFRNNI